MDENVSEFFQILGEIWRDITAVEFLMRCALAQKAGEIETLPKPPYIKGNSYTAYPDSFAAKYFGNVAEEFNKEFPHLSIPKELIDLRNAMAHGFIAEVNNRGFDELVKFKKVDDSLKVEFSMDLEIKRLRQIRQSLKEFRRHIMVAAADK